MLDHPGITVELGTDALKRLDLSEGRICLDGAEFSGPVIYTGQADELFAFRFGPLPYRTLDFRFETLAQDDFQGCGTVNYTVDEDYTRITEFKHLTGQVKPGVTTIVKEYSRAFTGAPARRPIMPSSIRKTTAGTPSTGQRRSASPTCTCWAVWPSTNTTTWTPSQPGHWSWPGC